MHRTYDPVLLKPALQLLAALITHSSSLGIGAIVRAAFRNTLLPAVCTAIFGDKYGNAMVECRRALVAYVRSYPDEALAVQDGLLAPVLLNSSSSELVPKSAVSAISETLGDLSAAGSSQTCAATIESLMAAMQASDSTVTVKCISVSTLGEIGRWIDISGYSKVQPLLGQLLSDSSDDVRDAAAKSLGTLTLGNMEFYLPSILQAAGSAQLPDHTRAYYIAAVVHTLQRGGPDLSKNGISTETLNQIWPLLMDGCLSPDGRMRSAVTECIAHLILRFPSQIMPFTLVSAAMESRVDCKETHIF